MDNYIENKTVLITGSNRGIGKAILERFLEKGARRIYAGVRNLEKSQFLVEDYGERVHLVYIDLKDHASIKTAARVASDVELVVNNAGILLRKSPLEEEIHEKLDEQMQVNVHGLLAVAQAFAPVLKENGGGAIVQMNSVASMRSFGDFSSYAASKAASYSLTQSLGRYLKEQGTHVVSVHPGPIATDMAEEAGIMENAEPPAVVADAILEALATNTFHVFPDQRAQALGDAYQDFSEKIVLPVMKGE